MKRILVVDNEPQLVDTVCRIIDRSFTHFDMTRLTDWTEAVFKIKEAKEPFDLVITDFRMPRGREGLAVIKAARDRSPVTKVITMSSDMTHQDMVDCAADGHLEKPMGLVKQLASLMSQLIPDLEAKPT